ncbi:MAG: ABC transporter permease [Defluviitaleaceae bacterium]|nr:ABC transporter permease [Defluviitaleaceae bacterium]
MSSIDIIAMSFRNLFKRKLRTFLTILGVVVGTAAIIVMISLGLAVNANFEESLAQMGDIRVLTVRDPGTAGGGGMFVSSGGGGMFVSSGGGGVMIAGGRGGSASPGHGSEQVELDDNAVNAFKQIPNVQAVTPVVQIQMSAVSGRYSHTWMNVRGISLGAMEDFGYRLSEGDFLKGDTNGIVFGSAVGYEFRNPNDRNWWRNVDWDNRTVPIDLMNDRIEMSFETGFGWGNDNPLWQQNQPADTGQRPRPYRLSVNGILEPMGWDTDFSAFMDIEEVLRIRRAQQRYQQNEGQRQPGGSNASPNVFDSVMVMAADVRSVEGVRDEIVAMGFHVDSWFIDVLNNMQEMARSLQIFLGAIGAVSLFVAAIGIANTMVMAIYERTREIGIMKVIGASLKDIKRLFLLEAVLIGLIGGGLGVLISLGISYLLNNAGAMVAGGMMGMGMGGTVSLIPPWLCALALGFSSLIGLVSGYFPARRAMKLSALAAIRTE